MARRAVPISRKEIAIGYLSTFPPRECGIGTYTKHLFDAIGNLGRFKTQFVVAINEKQMIYNYDKSVRMHIMQDYPQDCAQAAEYFNSSNADLVSLQHEFGIFGGEWGEYVTHFIDSIRKPVVVTFHSVEPAFPKKAKDIIERLALKSKAIVVMANSAKEIMGEYNLRSDKVQVIQHGCPDIPFVSSDTIKPSLGLEGRVVLSTFGLIGRGKGIEYAIRALPAVVEKEPKILYLVIGETHPEVRRAEGESYRESLLNLVSELGLAKHVMFHNRFLTERELIRYLQATDIYLIPYISPNQVSSGTLVYAMGAGRAVVSTPFLHAKEVLAEGRGLLCEFKNPDSIAQSVTRLLGDKQLKHSMEKKAYSYSRGFTWRAVAQKYAALFARVLTQRTADRFELPTIRLDFLKSLTDGTGIIQHGEFGTPNRKEGYTTDDNARALIVCAKYLKLRNSIEVTLLADIYLSFLLHMQRSDGSFHNSLAYNRTFLDEVGSEDSIGRTLWACGYVLNSKLRKEKRRVAKEIFDRGLPWIIRTSSQRPKAFALLGLAQYQEAYPEDQNVVRNMRILADHLLEQYGSNSSNDWRWFEHNLTYANGRMPQALFETYAKTHEEKYLRVAKASFDFALSLQMIDDVFVPIGSNGWYKKGGERAFFDQQPIEAGNMTEAALAAFRSTGDKRYRQAARTVFGWFLGRNSLNVMVYNTETGGCRDGINPNGLNLNQGAEAIVSYLMARLDLEMTR